MKQSELSSWAQEREKRRKYSLITPLMILVIGTATVLTFSSLLVAFIVVFAVVLTIILVARLTYINSIKQNRVFALVPVGSVRSFAGDILQRFSKDNLMLAGKLSFDESNLIWTPRQKSLSFSAEWKVANIESWKVSKVWGLLAPNYYLSVKLKSGESVEFWVHNVSGFRVTAPAGTPELKQT